ncbi:conserved protein [Tepidicaulis marinus]|uniref:Conserved protein n=1 Tax=Tepidicaulis marinus TaxID=1333998 RepID=A0A081BA40_9HYPH|nr:inverse autotransporter beta-barrel domain-containing protein [Tepidicaulis marinus]GAK44908.1 conserved protein [Tepidicaulis marinus]
MLPAASAMAGDPPPTAKWSPWLEAAGFLSSERDRGEVSGFAPLYQDSARLVFADIKGKLFTDSLKEGNFALGYRQMTEHGWNLGAWAGYDIRRSEFGNNFSQASFGLEALSADYDFRLNGYVPLSGDKTANGLARVELSGSQIFITGGQEVALAGFDGEAGWRVPIETFLGGTEHHELRLYAGGFYFNDDKIDRALAGPRLRAEWRLMDFVEEVPGMRLTFETEIQHDDYRDGQIEAGVRLRIPLFGSSTSSLSPQERRMMEAIERDTDIVTAGTKREAVLDARSGVALNSVTTVDGNGDLTAASANAGANTLLIVDGGKGALVGTHIVTASNQTLVGGGTALALRGVQSGAVTTFTLPGTRPTLMTSGCFCGDVLTLDGGSNLHVSGMTLDGDMGAAGAGVVIGSDQRNLHLTNIAALDLSGPGVAMFDGNEVSIDGLSVLRNDFSGILVSNDNMITVRNTSMSGMTLSGIEIDTGNILVLENVLIDDTFFGPGIDAFDNNTISGRNVTLTRTGGPAIALVDDNQVNFTGLTVREAGFGFVYMENGNSVALSGADFSTTPTDGIYMDDGNSFTMTDTRMSGMGDDAFDIGANNALSISGTVISGSVGDDLFDFEGPGNVFSASTGNVKDAAAITADICDVSSGGFSGTLSFADGTVLQNGAAPCL